MGKRILAKVDALVETPPTEMPHTLSPTAETQHGAQADLFPDDLPENPPPLTDEQQRKIAKAKKYNYADYVTLTRDEYANYVPNMAKKPLKR